MDDAALALLQMLASGDDVPIHRATKRLGLSMSELTRLVAALGEDPSCDGLGLVALRTDGDRTVLRLTGKGRALCNP